MSEIMFRVALNTLNLIPNCFCTPKRNLIGSEYVNRKRVAIPCHERL